MLACVRMRERERKRESVCVLLFLAIPLFFFSHTLLSFCDGVLSGIIERQVFKCFHFGACVWTSCGFLACESSGKMKLSCTVESIIERHVFKCLHFGARGRTSCGFLACESLEKMKLSCMVEARSEPYAGQQGVQKRGILEGSV